MENKPKMKAYRPIKFNTIAIYEEGFLNVYTLLDDQMDYVDAKDLESAHASSLYELYDKRVLPLHSTCSVYAKDRMIMSRVKIDLALIDELKTQLFFGITGPSYVNIFNA